jgi:phosphoglycolate phosphatase
LAEQELTLRLYSYKIGTVLFAKEVRRLPIELLVSDFDGPILDSTTKSIRGHLWLAKKRGFRIPAIQEFRDVWGLVWEEVLQRLWRERWQEFREAFIRDVIPTLNYSATPGALGAFTEIKGLGIIPIIHSSRDNPGIREQLEKVGIPANLFSSIISTLDCPFNRPDPRCLDPVFERPGNIAREHILYLGDTLIDWQTTRNLGIHFLAYPSGLVRRSDFLASGVPPENIFDNMADLPSIIQTIT